MAVNAWGLYIYYLFDEQLAALEERAERARTQGADGPTSHPAAKLLTKVNELIYQLIPLDPSAAAFRQGNTLGKENRQWFRAKFSGRYRLFFRFSTQERAIVYAWINDEATLRKSGAKTDPYAVFQTMLAAGDPPQSFDDLLARSRKL